MNNRYYQALLENKFSPEFVADLEELCDKHNISDASLITKMHDLLQDEYDKEDITIWLENDSCYPSLAENEEFVEYLAHMYRKLSESNYGIWDNIEMAFTRVKDEPEWKEIVEAAYVEE